MTHQFNQPIDFKEESDALYELIRPLDDADLARESQFKSWTINDVIRHLHAWNRAADRSLNRPDEFKQECDTVIESILSGKPIREAESVWLDGAKNRELVEQWKVYYTEMADRFMAADPKKRVAWAGPDMSVRSSITARLMETWAHGQEVFDMLGVHRVNTDRIKNIAVLGVNTFGWTFANRKLDPPGPAPHVRLTAPSGEAWEWNDASETSLVEGSAEEFCQVVTQVRNIGDTSLKVVGHVATKWMAIAQCFAGPPEEPPAVGTRFTNCA